MNFLEIRNRIIQCLSEYLQCSIMLNNQQNPEAEYPYLFYSAAPYTPEGGQGDYQLEKLADGYLEKRTGEASCTFSFTCCSTDREVGNEYVLGEDEAFRFADKAAGWFLHAGYDTIAGMGITVDDVSAVQDRSTLMVDEEARRYGFDVRIRYVRTDTRKIGTIEHVVTKKGDSNEL